uniref:E3 ubiquitin-protein ligase RMA n=1 Tax=Brassica campestris TaxID=3711 RepID=M4CT33_BRACM
MNRNGIRTTEGLVGSMGKRDHLGVKRCRVYQGRRPHRNAARKGRVGPLELCRTINGNADGKEGNAPETHGTRNGTHGDVGKVDMCVLNPALWNPGWKWGGTGPGPESDLQLVSNETVNLADWTNNNPSERSSEAVTRIRTRHRTRFRQLNLPIPVMSETHAMDIELNQLMGSGAALQTGEGSERGNEDLKMCENNGGEAVGDGVSEKKGDWLNISDAKECPVCKGEVTAKTVTPIYGRGNHKREVEESLDTKIPMRPHAKRIESLRNTIQRSPFTIPMEEMIRRIQSRFERDSTPVPDFSNREASERVNDRANSILNRLMTSRGVRSEQNQASAAAAATASEDINLNPDIAAPDLEGDTTARFHPLLIRRQLQSHRVARISNFTSALSSAERLVDAYFRTHPLGRNHNHQELNHHSPVVVDDRDSFSSIAAVINSESQVDTAVEIDSMVTLSTSSSRRRNENGSRVSDVDSADSRPPRRRRFT